MRKINVLKKLLIVALVLVCFEFVFAQSHDPNWPLKLRPGSAKPVSALNSSAYKFAGYCASGQGDVTITFGSLTFAAPCDSVLGIYRHEADVSAEVTTNPIYHCATQSVSPVLCARAVTNEQAPPGLVFKPAPFKKIVPSNESNYRVIGDCAPVGAAISIDIGLELSVLTGTCAVNNSFSLIGNVSSVLDGIGIPVSGHINDGGTITTVTTTVVKGVKVTIDSAANITATNYLSYDISGTCSDEGLDIALNIGGFVPSALPTCTSSIWSLTGLDLSSLAEGSLVITADHTDALGNSAVQVVDNIVKDTIVPSLLSWTWVLDPLSGSSSTDEMPEVQATLAEDTVVVKLYDDALCLSQVGGDQIVVTGSLLFSGVTYTSVTEDGSKNFYGVGVDLVGNSSACVDLSLNYFLDSVDPNTAGSLSFDSAWVNVDDESPEISWTAVSDPSPSGGVSDLDIGLTANMLGGTEVSSGYVSLTTTDTDYTYSPGVSVFSECVDYFASLHVTDGAGNESHAVTAMPFKYDGTAPAFVGNPIVYDFATASSATGINWSGISLNDSCSGLVDIELAIGTSLSGEEVVSFSSLPIDILVDTKYKIEDGVDGFSLSLQIGQLYYTTLKFIDLAGNESSVSVGPWRIPLFKISTSAESTCGVDGNEAVKCWGGAYQGSMGYGDNTRTSVGPVTVGAPGSDLSSGWKQVGSGVRYSCALSDIGGVKCWGQGDYGQLGDGSIDDNFVPEDVIGLSLGVKHISVGFRHTCAVLDSGGVKCWGLNGYGQLGNGGTLNLSTPVDVIGLTNVVQVSVGRGFSCALLNTAEVKCWGQGNYGQLGNGSTATQTVPVLVSGIDNATYITTGLYHACATLLGGSLKCWGRGANGRLGNGVTGNQPTPVLISGVTNTIEVEAYNGSTCALNFTGGVNCWGVNADYQVGDGTNVQKTTPVIVLGLSSGVLTLSKGSWAYHVCVMTTGKVLKCWGRNSKYQTGASNTTADVETAGDVRVFTGKVLKIDGGQHFTCALEDDGSGLSGGLRCWGRGGNGRLGNGGTVNVYPVSYVLGLESGVKDFSAGYYHVCALVDDGLGAGGVKCWGRNNQGQLGNNSLVDQLLPVDIAGLTSGVIAVSAHLYHTCALTNAGATYCWGQNNQGQLGDGTTINSLVPVAVLGAGASNIRSIATGRYHTCGVTTADALYCWGQNSRGQLGDGTTTRRTSPVLVAGMGAGVESVSAGYDHTCSVSTLGALTCWGRNNIGFVGDGTTVQRTTPVAVVGMSSGVNLVSAGYRYTCASMDDGGMHCWGDSGNYGRLGDGTIIDSSVPVEVINYTGDVDQVATGKLTNGQTCMIQTNGEAYCWGYYGYYNHGWGSYWTTDAASYKSPFKTVSTFSK